MENLECKERLKTLGCVCVVPTYNNARTVAQVVDNVLEWCADVIVVNDGSTDHTHTLLSQRTDITLLEYPDGRNRGKGVALRTALRKACELGYNYAITIDADGQHFASDLPVFVQCITQSPETLIIGARNLQAEGMPGKITFAYKFSNFWFKVETGQTLTDTQSGFRLYPLRKMQNMHLLTRRYEFEVEVIVRLAWRGVKVTNVPIKVVYPEDRVSHFRPLKDFTRISLLNTVLVLGAVLYYYPKRFVQFIVNQAFRSGQSALKLSLSIALGSLMSVTPIWGFQMVAALALSCIFRLNNVRVEAFSNISIPPRIPLIIYASLTIGGKLFGTEVDFIPSELTPDVALQSVKQYVAGSLILAAILGVATFIIAYVSITAYRQLKR